jgi:hypothetical protein
MPEDVMDRMRAADRARAGESLSDEHRARLLAASVVRRAEPAPRVNRLRGRAPRRALLLAGLVALASAGVGTAAGVFSGQSGREVREDYAAVTRRVPMPPGYRWGGADAPDTVDGVGAVYAGRNAALMTATAQALCAWWDAWLRAHARDDAAGMRAALAGHDKVLAMVPRAPRDGSEDAGGSDPTYFAAEHALVDDARAGRPGNIRSSVAINCTGPAAPRHAP